MQDPSAVPIATAAAEAAEKARAALAAGADSAPQMLPGVEQMLTADEGDLANMLEGANQAELMKMMQTLTLQRDLLEQEEHAREQALNAEKERMSLMQQLAGEQTRAEALQAQTAAAEVAAGSQMQQQEIGVGVDASDAECDRCLIFPPSFSEILWNVSCVGCAGLVTSSATRIS